MKPATVSFVIATHGRTDALRATLTSLVRQEHQDWTAIVVGDCCNEKTEHAIRSISDPRIKYYNLPIRCGEQSGPNSFGLSIATGDYLVYLNHDDILLSDHLSYGIDQICRKDADMFFGKYAMADSYYEKDGLVMPLFTHILPNHQDSTFMLDPYTEGLDPSSFWIMRMQYAKRVGKWRHAADIWRTPISDWLCRCWKQRGKFVFGEQLTGLRIHTHVARGNMNKSVPNYQNPSPEHSVITDYLERYSADEIRRLILNDSEISKLAFQEQPSTWHKRLHRKLHKKWRQFRHHQRRKFAGFLYQYFDIDLAEQKLRKLNVLPGQEMNELSRSRTGQGIGIAADLLPLMDYPERFRVI